MTMPKLIQDLITSLEENSEIWELGARSAVCDEIGIILRWGYNGSVYWGNLKVAWYDDVQLREQEVADLVAAVEICRYNQKMSSRKLLDKSLAELTQ